MIAVPMLFKLQVKFTAHTIYMLPSMVAKSHQNCVISYLLLSVQMDTAALDSNVL